MEDIKVSVATLDDLDRLMVLAKEFQEEAPSQHEWDEDKSRAVVAASFDDDNQVIITFKVNGEIVGMLYGVVTEPFLSYKKVATELAWFVSKDYRGKGALAMVNIFEQWALFKGATAVVMADIEGVTPLGKAYEKLGYSKLETSYSKDI